MVLDSPGAGVEGYLKSSVSSLCSSLLSVSPPSVYWTFKRNTKLTAMVCFSFGLWSYFFLQYLKPVTACMNDNVNSRRMLMRLLETRLVLRGLGFLIYFVLPVPDVLYLVR